MSKLNKYEYLRDVEATQILMGFGSYVEADEEEKRITDINSNFISMMKSTIQLNPSIEFKKLHNDLKQYTSSYDLVVLKNEEIFEKLVSYINEENQKYNPVVIITVIDLLIALIKDLRSEISFDKLVALDLFQKVINLIDVRNLELMDQVFTFFCHCFKYLLPMITQNLDKFYSIYFQVLHFRNKHIRKFATESFSYILRKLSNDKNFDKIMNLCFKPIHKPYNYLQLEVQNSTKNDVEMEPEQQPNDSSSESEKGKFA
jgi:hypothetical protein